MKQTAHRKVGEKNGRKAVLSLLLGGMMLAGPFFSAFQPVMAAEPENTEATIDTTMLGSVTVIKYENDHSSADDPDPSLSIGTPSTSTVHKPLNDVTYTLYRVAEIVQGKAVGTGSNSRVEISYQSLLKDSTNAHNTIEIPSGTVSQAELSDWVNSLRDSADNSKRISNESSLQKWTGVTGSQGTDGVYRFESLPVGVYILYEESNPSLVTDTQCAVFSLPMTAVNDGNDSTSQKDDSAAGDNMAGSTVNVGAFWDYHILIRPKNQVKALSVEKHIVADEGADTDYDIVDGANDPANDRLTDTEDYFIGQNIRYSLSAEVPSNIGEMKYFYLTDRLSAGQTFINDVSGTNQNADMEVWGINARTGASEFIPRVSKSGTVNWTVTGPGEAVSAADAAPDTEGNSQKISFSTYASFSIYFNTQSLSKQSETTTKREAVYNKIWVTYNARLNTKAILYGKGNPNDVALNYSHTTTSNLEEIPNEPGIPKSGDKIDTLNPKCPDTAVFTYDFEIRKQSEEGTALAGVKFVLLGADGEVLPTYLQEDGRYAVDLSRSDTSQPLVTGDDGKISVIGLRSGTYQVVETKTKEGYNLLKEPVVMIFSGSTQENDFDYELTENGRFFQIETGKGYYYLANSPYGNGQEKIALDLSKFTDGDYIAFDETTELYSYTLDGDTGKMTKNAALVTKWYDHRTSGSQQMICTCSCDGDPVPSLFIVNRKGIEVPSTGGIGIWPFVIPAIVLIGAGTGLFLFGRKKHRR